MRRADGTGSVASAGTRHALTTGPAGGFRFNREQFIRQHLVVPEKASSYGVHNPAFTSDGGVGVLAVRPALPSLPTPPPSPVPVPPPRKKRRARPPQQHQHQHQHQLQQHQHQHQLQQQQPHGPPPLPPSRSRAGTRSRGKDGQSEDDDESAINPNDSILSPAHTMELLKRMAKMEARRARSMDSLEVLDVGVAARGRSLPGRGSAPEHYYQQHPDGPRSLDLDLNKEVRYS
ncbi:E3 SUMO-protein ligase RanBP2 [Frankliniella fusca]|uniref:E3 SUMO-protein ligase RanBP2 n=1 Tax=Frankliniella fusca TaxID=407009 RepID=A0AAE1H8D0_9NEOP|nr:E3 SUMO-protein ligase RanBP2 [Frankliniella fusca]